MRRDPEGPSHPMCRIMQTKIANTIRARGHDYTTLGPISLFKAALLKGCPRGPVSGSCPVNDFPSNCRVVRVQPPLI